MPYTTDPKTGAQVPTGTAVPATSRDGIRTTLTNHESRLDTLEAGIDDIPIGDSTPSTGKFTTVTVSGSLILGSIDSGPTLAASGSNLIISAALVDVESPVSITDALDGSSATSSLEMSVFWDTSGNPTAIKLNVTNTASGASSKLMDLQVDSSSKASISKAGNMIIAGTLEVGGPAKMPFYPITLPSAITYPYAWAYYGSASGGKYMVFSDGTQWRYPDGTLV